MHSSNDARRFAITNAHMAELDRRSLAIVDQIILMENAGRLMAEAIVDLLSPSARWDIHIVAGRGNNGGDGLVCARHLLRSGLSCTVYLMPGTPSQGCKTMLQALDLEYEGRNDEGRLKLLRLSPDMRPLVDVLQGEQSSSDERLVLVDAWLGSGANRPLEGKGAEILAGLWREISSARPKTVRIALDVPSGISDDWEDSWPLLPADVTLAVQYAREVMYTSPARDACGRILVLRPGFPHSITKNLEQAANEALAKEMAASCDGLLTAVVDDRELQHLHQALNPGVHKGGRGKLSIFGASSGQAGAGLLCSRGAMAAGVGMIRLHCSEQAVEGVLADEPAIMYRRLFADSPNDGSGSSTPNAGGGPERQFLPDDWADALVVGPGLGRDAERESQYLSLLTDLLNAGTPLVIDADGLYWLGRLADVASEGTIQNARAPVVLTPHVGEAALLSAMDRAQLSRHPDKANEAIRRRLLPLLGHDRPVYLVIKSSVSWIYGPDGRMCIFEGREPSLGCAGSGDVLAGLIGGFLPSYPAHQALLLAMAIHLRAGKRAFRRLGWYSAKELAQEAALILGEWQLEQGAIG